MEKTAGSHSEEERVRGRCVSRERDRVRRTGRRARRAGVRTGEGDGEVGGENKE